jgi:hypothetical protein
LANPELKQPLLLKDVLVIKGMHSYELHEQIKKCWNNDSAFIIASPMLNTDSVLQAHFNLEMPKDFIFGLFTSGTSTGKPRLILYSKKNIMTSLESIRALYDVKKIDHIFCYPQPTHVFGFVLGYLHSIIYNIKISFAEGAYSKAAHALWLNTLTEGTLTLGTPVHMIDLIKKMDELKIVPKKSYTSIVGGAAVSKKLWLQMQNALSIQSPSVGYGASEASPGICHLGPGIEPYHDGDIGQILAGVKILKNSEEGFYFNGDNKCLGLLTEKGLLQEDEILIKDQLKPIQNNRFCILGRTDTVINRGALKYYPETLEAALHNEDIKAVVVPVYDERLGSDVAVLVHEESILDSEAKNIIQKKIHQIMSLHFGIAVLDKYVVFNPAAQNQNSTLSLSLNLKLNRRESLKKVLCLVGLTLPISTKWIASFMPHRPPAIWVDEIISFDSRGGRGRVFLDPSAHYFDETELRQSSLVEFVAQSYGYCFVLSEIFNNKQISNVSQTMIAEIRNVKYENLDVFNKILSYPKSEWVLDVVTECTHDFVRIKVIKGTVFFKDILLLSIDLKAVVF